MPFRKFLPYLLIIGFFFIILLVAFISSFFGSGQNQSSPQPSVAAPFSPRPQEVDSQNLQYHPDSNIIVQTIDENSQKMLDKDTAIGNLIAKLPYNGTYFSLEYSYSSNSFTARFSQTNRTQANQEFDEFLKSNNIENRNWLYNLKINNI